MDDVLQITPCLHREFIGSHVGGKGDEDASCYMKNYSKVRYILTKMHITLCNDDKKLYNGWPCICGCQGSF